MKNPFAKRHVIDIIVDRKNEYVTGTLGISDERKNEIHQALDKGIEKYNSVCDVMQFAVDKATITDPKELLYVGFCLSKRLEKYAMMKIVNDVAKSFLKGLK